MPSNGSDDNNNCLDWNSLQNTLIRGRNETKYSHLLASTCSPTMVMVVVEMMMIMVMDDNSDDRDDLQ